MLAIATAGIVCLVLAAAMVVILPVVFVLTVD